MNVAQGSHGFRWARCRSVNAANSPACQGSSARSSASPIAVDSMVPPRYTTIVMYSSAVPARVDRESRRRDVAEAVWRVLETGGFAGLSMRSVAAEMGATTGLVTHWFGTKDELVDHAL